MAKTKEQCAAAHFRQLDRAARKRQGSTVQRTVSSTSAVKPTAHSQAWPQKQQSVVSHMDLEQACPKEIDVTQHDSFVENEESQKRTLLHSFSAEITGHRHCTDGSHDIEFIIFVTGLDGTSTVERGYADFEALLAQVRLVMPELPALPPNTLQHACAAGLQHFEEGLQHLLAAMLEADATFKIPELRKFLLADASDVQLFDHKEVAEESQNAEAVDGMHEEIVLFPNAPLETAGEKDEQEMQEVSVEDEEITQDNMEPAQEQAVQDKLEEPKAALIEIISDSEATTDVFPMCADFSGDEDDEEMTYLDLPIHEEGEISCLQSLDVGTAQSCDVASAFGASETEFQIALAMMARKFGGPQPCMSAAWPEEAGTVEFQKHDMNSGEAPADVFQVCADSRSVVDDQEVTSSVEQRSSLAAEVDQLICSLSLHMNSLTESFGEKQMPTKVDVADLNSQYHEESHICGDAASALGAYGTAFEAVFSFKFGGPLPSVPAAEFHEAGKVKLQMHDLHGAIQSFAEAEAIHRQMGTLKTLAGAHLLLDISVAKLVSGDVHAASAACEGMCDYAGLLQTPAAMQFLHDVAELPCQCGTPDGVHKILDAAFTFMEDVHKAEFDTFANRWSQRLLSPVGRFFGECS